MDLIRRNLALSGKKGCNFDIGSRPVPSHAWLVGRKLQEKLSLGITRAVKFVGIVQTLVLGCKLVAQKKLFLSNYKKDNFF